MYVRYTCDACYVIIRPVCSVVTLFIFMGNDTFTLHRQGLLTLKKVHKHKNSNCTTFPKKSFIHIHDQNKKTFTKNLKKIYPYDDAAVVLNVLEYSCTRDIRKSVRDILCKPGITDYIKMCRVCEQCPYTGYNMCCY